MSMTSTQPEISSSTWERPGEELVDVEDAVLDRLAEDEADRVADEVELEGGADDVDSDEAVDSPLVRGE